jgi:hypothetical protein
MKKTGHNLIIVFQTFFSFSLVSLWNVVTHIYSINICFLYTGDYLEESGVIRLAVSHLEYILNINH